MTRSPRMLIVVSGLPMTGKSTIAAAVARARHLPVLSVDPIESAIVRAGVTRTFETGLAAYLVVETLADTFLAAGLDPIVDSVSSVEPARALWRDLAARHRASLKVVVCELDEATLRGRLATRRRALAIGEPSWEEVQERREEWTPWPERHLVLAGDAPVASNVALALDYLSSAPGANEPIRRRSG